MELKNDMLAKSSGFERQSCLDIILVLKLQRYEGDYADIA